MSNNPSSGLALAQYYVSLLILQYLNKPKASGTIQAILGATALPQVSVESIAFTPAPVSGSFILSYGAGSTAAINWNDSAATVQTKLQAVAGLGSVTVSGSIAAGLSVTFTGVYPPAALLTVAGNSTGSSIAIAATDTTLPLAVLNAYNIIGSSTAIGVQLDVIGKYCGVTRKGTSPTGTPISLSDQDFLTLIKIAIIQNSAGSSLASIQSLLAQFFPNAILVFDYANMQMSYLISTTLGSVNLAYMLVNNGLLPSPMGVQVAAVAYAPVINTFFGFRTYILPGFNISPFNTYLSYNNNSPWLTYADAII